MGDMLWMRPQENQPGTALIGVFAGNDLVHKQRVGVRVETNEPNRSNLVFLDVMTRVIVDLGSVAFWPEPYVMTRVIVDLGSVAIRETCRLGALANGTDRVTLAF